MGTVQCFGIYDANCNGASEESPVELVASPGLDLDKVNESSVGSCIYHMVLGSGTYDHDHHCGALHLAAEHQPQR
eukprot:Skav218329  [mRNA]  locus=scaffold2239:560965:566323:+ [translate_table: standard]